MNISPKTVRIDQDQLWVELSDGPTLGVPLTWFPRLVNATHEQLAAFKLSHRGVHWEELDEDISIEGLLVGHGDRTSRLGKVV